MKTLIIMFFIAAFVVSAVECPAFSADIEQTVKEKVDNDICPVMGGNIDKETPYRVKYRGKIIGFSSPGCPEAFEANPEKYSGNISYKD